MEMWCREEDALKPGTGITSVGMGDGSFSCQRMEAAEAKVVSQYGTAALQQYWKDTPPSNS